MASRAPRPIKADLRGANLTGPISAGPTSAGPTFTGPTSAGPTSAGPTSAGPTSAGPTSARPTSARPTSAGPTSAGPTSAGPTSARPTSARPTSVGADLREADLSGANLRGTNLSGADLSGANLSGATLLETILADLDLSSCKGLDSCVHHGPSIIDHRTLQRSGPLPLVFLRGVGLPDNLIDYLPSLLNQPIQFYSCFISYSSKDQAFAERLHADLQAKGVRCWFAPHDMQIGAKILDAIDEAIRLRDKVLLVLSEDAIASDWVEGEVTRALDEERERKRPLLFPIRLDDAVLETKEAWARLLRGQRNIGDFTRWKEHDAYQQGPRAPAARPQGRGGRPTSCRITPIIRPAGIVSETRVLLRNRIIKSCR